MISESLISLFCAKPDKVPRYNEASPEKIPSNPLELLEAEYPDLSELLKGKRVLDFGSGFGHQTAALANSSKYGCASVNGLEINLSYINASRKLYPNVTFISLLVKEKYDVVISQDSMEHFFDPEVALREMTGALNPGGLIFVTFGPPWASPWGSHMHFFCRLPWVNLFFSEKAVMAVRSRYRSDGARRYRDVESGLNQMTLHKFERIVRRCKLQVVQKRYTAIKGLNILTHIPLIRELCTNRVTVVLQRPA